ncbi:MAG: hypothetical protein B7X29_11245 [Halothiobacillus sp. 13-55-115]|nr:MAG: hypothetical protein B7X29_11245 [Halothiobacillus sp. 13-55-115]
MKKIKIFDFDPGNPATEFFCGSYTLLYDNNLIEPLDSRTEKIRGLKTSKARSERALKHGKRMQCSLDINPF